MYFKIYSDKIILSEEEILIERIATRVEHARQSLSKDSHKAEIKHRKISPPHKCSKTNYLSILFMKVFF